MMEKTDTFLLAELEDKTLETVYDYIRHAVPRPFGLLLSGGFDSGLLAAITKPDFVFTLRFPYGIRYDESRYADSIIDHLNLRSKTTIIEPTKENFEQYAPEAIRAMGEPVTHFSLVPFYITMKVAGDKMRGLGVEPRILSGEGPDEYLGGYARQIIFDELNKLFTIPELRGYYPTIEKVIGKQNDLVMKYGEMMGYDPKQVANYLDLPLPLQGAIGKMDMELGVIEKMEQKMAQAAGVELHYPYINDEYANYCYNLPDRIKVRDGVTKWGFRQICKKFLPASMMDRAKMGGPVAPVNHWLNSLRNGEFDKKAWIEYQERILNEQS